jgi:predicted dehydrogenase
MGIIGAGGFAQFAARAFVKVPGIELAGVTDINKKAALELGGAFGIRVYEDFDQTIGDDNIDLLYIATPPWLHYTQSRNALLAGKHVICEKPAALTTSEAEELRQLARSRNLLYVVNLIQRYNPLFSIVKKIINNRLLGNFLHGFFENYASDEKLVPDHWFWDETKSGGIFIEHGVHFFDLFEGWLGEGKLVSALQLHRPDISLSIVDRVQATVLYEDGVVNFYHGFDQARILDRQEMRIEFERGEISLYEWVPVRMKLYGILETGQLKKLRDMLPESSILHAQKDMPKHTQQDKPKQTSARFKEFIAEDHITLNYENDLGKEKLYQQMLSTMLTDQLAWIQSHDHARVIDDNNALRSLGMAVQADRMAKNFNY